MIPSTRLLFALTMTVVFVCTSTNIYRNATLWSRSKLNETYGYHWRQKVEDACASFKKYFNAADSTWLIRRRTAVEYKRKKEVMQRKKQEYKAHTLDRRRRKDLFVLRTTAQMSQSQGYDMGFLGVVSSKSPAIMKSKQKPPAEKPPKGFDFKGKPQEKEPDPKEQPKDPSKEEPVTTAAQNTRSKSPAPASVESVAKGTVKSKTK